MGEKATTWSQETPTGGATSLKLLTDGGEGHYLVSGDTNRGRHQSEAANRWGRRPLPGLRETNRERHQSEAANRWGRRPLPGLRRPTGGATSLKLLTDGGEGCLVSGDTNRERHQSEAANRWGRRPLPGLRRHQQGAPPV